MSSVFSIALSSLQAESEAINTTGHNLANVNTTGFKESDVNFRDLVAASLGGESNGLGVSRPINQQIFSQGPLSSSKSPWATAIQGNGFFVLKQSSGQQVYTRDGNFTLGKDSQGNILLQTLTGENVQGWAATNGKISTSTPRGDIKLDAGGTVPPNPTSGLSFTANLNASGNATNGTGNMSVPVQVTDSLGNQHTLTINFTQKTSANTWDYKITIPTSDLASGTGTTTPPPDTQLTAGTLAFNSDGTLASNTPAPVPPATTSTADTTLAPIAINVQGLKDGANNLSINWSLKNTDGTSMMTQFAQNSAYSNLVQDGAAAGTLSDLGMGDDGQIIAKYSNGQQKTIAQVALAAFQNQNSLQDVGNNNFAVTGNTADPIIGLSQTGNLGHIVNGQLEGSNVDMATQFTNLISYQQGYSASSKVITTANNMSQDLLNLIH